MKLEQVVNKLGLRSLRRRSLLIGCTTMIIAVLLLGWQQWSVRDIRQGRSFLKSKKYGRAVSEFKTELSRRKYSSGARGLLLFSVAMQNDYRRPVLALTGVDEDGLIRLVAFQSMRNNPALPVTHPVIRDILKQSDRAAVQVRRHLKKHGVHTRDWADTETVLDELAGAVWANTDIDLVEKNDPESLLLDFTSEYLALKGGPRAFRARAHRYLINRLSDRGRPLDTEALIHNEAFIEMLETEASGTRATSWKPAVNLLYRHRLFKKLEWISNKHKLMPEIAALKREPGAPPAKNTKEWDKLLKQRSTYKPFADMSGFGFDPTAIHWRERGKSGGYPNPLEWFVWVYGVRSDGRRFDMVYVFSQNYQLDLLRFDHGKKLSPESPMKGLIMDFMYCETKRELVFKTESVVSDGQVDVVAPATVEVWHPFRPDFENLSLKPAGPARDVPCI